MNDFETKLERCKKLLYEEEIVKEYFRLRDIVQSDPDLVALDHEIHQHQHLMCIHNDDDQIYQNEKHLYEEQMKEFQSNPLVENYFQVREEVYALLNEVKEILE